jgi:hypothetical protein
MQKLPQITVPLVSNRFPLEADELFGITHAANDIK